MGFFGTYLYTDGGWAVGVVAPSDDEASQPPRVGGPPVASEPWLLVDIHDSDITTLTYRPKGPGSGVAYLGITPRTYFEDESASDPTDADREAAGLAWWRSHLPGEAAPASELRAFLAEDEDPDDFDDEDDEDLDDGEIFVEIKTARFLAAFGLPVPDDIDR